MPLTLNVIVASTRPGRIGRAIADWFFGLALEEGSFRPVMADLADFRLPVYDEPHHPRLGRYEHAHTRAWAASVGAADAFAIVTPEYNFSTPPALVNAVDYVYAEWGYKPAGLVSYGGISGGLRGAQMTKQLLTAVRVMPVSDQVAITMAGQLVNDGRFEASEQHARSARVMLGELKRWAGALKGLREAA